MVDNKINGLMVYYYFICKRKLWYYYNQINMENENEAVQIGAFLDKTTYTKYRKHILINDEINIDFIEKTKIIHEIKKSRSIEEASIWQVKYYLFYLAERGIDQIEAKIDYPLLKQTVEVELTDIDVARLKVVLEEIKQIIESEAIPNILIDTKCKRCAFHDLCMI